MDKLQNMFQRPVPRQDTLGERTAGASIGSSAVRRDHSPSSVYSNDQRTATHAATTSNGAADGLVAPESSTYNNEQTTQSPSFPNVEPLSIAKGNTGTTTSKFSEDIDQDLPQENYVSGSEPGADYSAITRPSAIRPGLLNNDVASTASIKSGVQGKDPQSNDPSDTLLDEQPSTYRGMGGSGRIFADVTGLPSGHTDVVEMDSGETDVGAISGSNENVTTETRNNEYSSIDPSSNTEGIAYSGGPHPTFTANRLDPAYNENILSYHEEAAHRLRLEQQSQTAEPTATAPTRMSATYIPDGDEPDAMTAAGDDSEDTTYDRTTKQTSQRFTEDLPSTTNETSTSRGLEDQSYDLNDATVGRAVTTDEPPVDTNRAFTSTGMVGTADNYGQSSAQQIGRGDRNLESEQTTTSNVSQDAAAIAGVGASDLGGDKYEQNREQTSTTTGAGAYEANDASATAGTEDMTSTSRSEESGPDLSGLAESDKPAAVRRWQSQRRETALHERRSRYQEEDRQPRYNQFTQQSRYGRDAASGAGFGRESEQQAAMNSLEETTQEAAGTTGATGTTSTEVPAGSDEHIAATNTLEAMTQEAAGTSSTAVERSTEVSVGSEQHIAATNTLEAMTQEAAGTSRTTDAYDTSVPAGSPEHAAATSTLEQMTQQAAGTTGSSYPTTAPRMDEHAATVDTLDAPSQQVVGTTSSSDVAAVPGSAEHTAAVNSLEAITQQAAGTSGATGPAADTEASTAHFHSDKTHQHSAPGGTADAAGIPHDEYGLRRDLTHHEQMEAEANKQTKGGVFGFLHKSQRDKYDDPAERDTTAKEKYFQGHISSSTSAMGSAAVGGALAHEAEARNIPTSVAHETSTPIPAPTTDTAEYDPYSTEQASAVGPATQDNEVSAEEPAERDTSTAVGTGALAGGPTYDYEMHNVPADTTGFTSPPPVAETSWRDTSATMVPPMRESTVPAYASGTYAPVTAKLGTTVEAPMGEAYYDPYATLETTGPLGFATRFTGDVKMDAGAQHGALDFGSGDYAQRQPEYTESDNENFRSAYTNDKKIAPIEETDYAEREPVQEYSEQTTTNNEATTGTGYYDPHATEQTTGPVGFATSYAEDNKEPTLPNLEQIDGAHEPIYTSTEPAVAGPSTLTNTIDEQPITAAPVQPQQPLQGQAYNVDNMIAAASAGPSGTTTASKAVAPATLPAAAAAPPAVIRSDTTASTRPPVRWPKEQTGAVKTTATSSPPVVPQLKSQKGSLFKARNRLHKEPPGGRYPVAKS